MADRDASDDEWMFDRCFAQRAPDLAIVAEDDSHRPFLRELFVACSPLRGVLPDAVVQHQAAMRETAYRGDYPGAMRRVVLASGAPIGRIVVDWASDGGASLVDIAVLPARQRAGTGMAMVRAYLDVVDQRGYGACLQVMPDNPTLRLYTRLGFVPVEAKDFVPYLDMMRAPRGAG